MESINLILTLNPATVAAATLAMLVVSFLWYSQLLFGKAWIRLSGIRPGDIRPADARRNYIVTLITSLAISALVGLLAQHADGNATALFAGAAFIWMFVMLEQLNYFIWERQPFALFLLQTFRSLAALMASAAVFYFWR